MRLKAIAAAFVAAASVAGVAVAGVPFVHGYKVETLRTYDADGRAVGHIDVAALPKTARPVAWGGTLVGIRAKDGRVVFVSRDDLVIGDRLKPSL